MYTPLIRVVLIQENVKRFAKEGSSLLAQMVKNLPSKQKTWV